MDKNSIENSFEKKIQKRFLDLVENQKEKKASNAFGIYQKLVFYRYEEIIKNTFLEYCKIVSEEKLNETIYEFIKNPPQTPFVWKIAKDYMKFVKKNKYFNKKKFLYEVLYFDWVELELIMKEYKIPQEDSFSWDNKYILNDNSKVKKFKYNIILGEYTEKRENFVLIYYDFSENEVFYREINELIFLILKSINDNKNISKTLKSLCKKYELNHKEAKEFLTSTFTELLNLKVIVKV